MEPLPDPSRRQALALVVGSGGFWLCSGIAIGGAAVLEVDAAAVFLAPALAFAVWLFIGGIGSIAAGDEPLTLAERLFEHTRRRGTWRFATPSYLRRAADALGWNPGVVLAVLGVLLVIDLGLALALFVAAFSSSP